MEAFIDKTNDKIFVKANGIVTEATIVKKLPVSDPVTPAINTAKAELDEAEKLLSNKIKDIKEKAELLAIGTVTQSEMDAKNAEYTPLKSDYDAKKTAYEALL